MSPLRLNFPDERGMSSETRNDDVEIIPTPSLFTRVRLRAVVWLACLAVILSLHVWFPHIDAEANDTYNVDNGGRNALFQFLKRRLPMVSRNHDRLVNRLARLDPQTTLCILGPARSPSPREWEAILAWVNRGGHLIFAAEWDDPALTIPAINVSVSSTVITPSGRMTRNSKSKSRDKNAKGSSVPSSDAKTEPEAKAQPVPDNTPPDPATLLTRDLLYTWKSNGWINAPGADVLVKSSLGVQAVRVRHGLGTIILTASDYIFSNTALFEEGQQNGYLVTRLLDAAGTSDTVMFDESLNETGTPRAVGLLLDPVLRPTTIQFAALILIFGWRGNRRFGALSAPSSKPRHDVAEHTNSLGNLYYKANHGTGVLREYLEQLKTELRLRHVGAQIDRFLKPIAEQAGLSLAEVKRRLDEAEIAVKSRKLSRHEAANQIRKLAVLRQAAQHRGGKL
jgi:hypothetical protein